LVECIIFDCDGTLVDSEHLCNLALEQLLTEFGIVETVEALLSRYRGHKLANILKDVEDRHRVSLNSRFVPRYRDLVAQLFLDKLEPIEGVIDALESIQLPKCVASSGPMEKIRQALQVTNLANYFRDNIFSSYDIQSWKPEPDLFLWAANAMGVASSKCAVIEDSLVGIEAAKRAGMIPFLYSPSQQSTYNVSISHITFGDMKLLPALINQISINEAGGLFFDREVVVVI
jgi:HAD superfamily hydrolase (TIGR01509 family)